MGYTSLIDDQKSLLQEVARQAYGIAGGEGIEGGEGRIGLMEGADGKLRAVKYNTHLGERLFGSRKTQAMIDGANKLRNALILCASAVGLKENEINEIRRLLGLAEGKESSTSLLDRKIVAKVLTKIGGQTLWQDAVGTNGSHAEKSAKDMSFEIQKQRTAYGIGTLSAKGVAALEKLGITADGLSKAVNNLAAAKGIVDAKQKAVLGRLTATYLISRAEQDESGLPASEKLYQEIAEGRFTGAKFALFRLRKIGMKELGGDSANLLRCETSPVNDYFLRLDEDECEFAAAMLGRLPPMDTNKIDNMQWYGVSALFLHQVLAKRPDIEKLQAKNGSLSFDDLCGVLNVKPEGRNPSVRLINLMYKLELDLARRMVGVDGVNIEYFGDFQNSKYETLIARYGMSPEEAVRQLFGNPVAFKLKDNITVFDPHGSEQGESVDTLVNSLKGDNKRTQGSFKVNGETFEFDGKNGGEKADQVVDALCKMLRCTRKDDPPNEQLKMLLIACGQGGNEMLNASGLPLRLDHAETHKSFVLKDNKDVVYTVRYKSKQGIKGHNDDMGIDLSATCVIKPDCTNKMTRFLRHPTSESLANKLSEKYGAQVEGYDTLRPEEKTDLLMNIHADVRGNWLESGEDPTDGYPEFSKEVWRQCIGLMPGLTKVDLGVDVRIKDTDDDLRRQGLTEIEQYFGEVLKDERVNAIHRVWQSKANDPDAQNKYIRSLPEPMRKLIASHVMNPGPAVEMLLQEILSRKAEKVEQQLTQQERLFLRMLSNDSKLGDKKRYDISNGDLASINELLNVKKLKD